MQKWQKVLCATMLILIALTASCATLANYFLPPLNQRHLRVSLDGAFTEYRWYERVCAKKLLGICVKHEDLEHLEKDFDFDKVDDRKKFNDMGFDCSVRKRPGQAEAHESPKQ